MIMISAVDGMCMQKCIYIINAHVFQFECGVPLIAHVVEHLSLS